MKTDLSAFFKLDSSDFIKGLAVAVLGAVFAFLAQQFNMPGFDFAGIQWDEVLRIAFAAGVAYLSKNLLTTSDGKLLGVAKL